MRVLKTPKVLRTQQNAAAISAISSLSFKKKLCKELWTHHNPYTKLRYCDDPVFVLAEIVNESELFSKGQQPIPEPYKTEFLAKFDKWLKENHTGKTSADFDLENLTEETLEELNKIYAK